MKKLSIIFGILAVLLSDIMCAHVAYDYRAMISTVSGAPTWVAFLIAIPYAIGIVVCVLLALIFRKKSLK